MARYTPQSPVNYNQNPPPDDGSTTEANRVKWATILTKLTDVLKTFTEAVDTEVGAALGRTFGSGVTSISTNYTVLTTDNGKVINVTSGSPTITLLAAGTATTEFVVTIKNSGNGTVTIDGDGSETIDGQTTLLVGKGSVSLFTDGSNWFTVNPVNQLAPGTGTELTISSGDIVPTTDGYYTVDTEADAASDDLDTIDDANIPEGTILIIRANNTARTVVVKNGSGNHTIHTADGLDFDLDDDEKSITLQLRSAEWYELTRSVAGILSTQFTSSGQTITSGGQLVLPHSLGSMPQLVQLRLVNTSSELGYALNDEVIINPSTQDSSGGRGASIVVDATNVTVRFSNVAAAFGLPRKDTGAVVAATNANWNLVVRAWV